MSHNRSVSDASDVSMASTETDASMNTVASSFKGDCTALFADLSKTHVELEDRASALITSLKGLENPKQYVPRWYARCKADPHRILSAMMDHATECGGEDSKRYVACAIIACTSGTKSSEDTHRALTELAITWFAYFLWVFKANSSHRKQAFRLLEYDSWETGTPTVVQATSLYRAGGAPESRDRDCKMQALKRQNYTCPLTGDKDITHPEGGDVRLRGAHLLKRSVTEFPPDDESATDLERSQYRFAMSTLDIISLYTSISHEDLVEIVQNIDCPNNMICMESNMHDSFDNYELALEATNTPNEYKVKSYVSRLPRGVKPGTIIHFKDESGEGIPLPYEKFLRLHAAISGVLHLSGASGDIDMFCEDLNKRGPGKGLDSAIATSGYEFLRHMDAQSAGNLVADAIAVH